MIISCNNVTLLSNKDFLKPRFYLIWPFHKGLLKNYVNEIEFSNIWNIHNMRELKYVYHIEIMIDDFFLVNLIMYQRLYMYQTSGW